MWGVAGRVAAVVIAAVVAAVLWFNNDLGTTPRRETVRPSPPAERSVSEGAGRVPDKLPEPKAVAQPTAPPSKLAFLLPGKRPAGAYIVGRVTPAVVGAAIAVQQIGADNSSSSLDLQPDGSFAIFGPQDGKQFELRFFRSGHGSVDRGPYRLAKDEWLDIGDVTFGRGHSLGFAVVDGAGQPATDVEVTISLPGFWTETPGIEDRTIAGLTSRVRLDGLPDGPMLLHINAQGLADRWIRVDRVTEFDPAEIVLEPAGFVEATVLNRDGTPRAGVKILRVMLRPMFDGRHTMIAHRFSAPTDTQGRTSLDLPGGRHELWSSDPDVSRTVDVEVAETTRVEFRPE